MQKKLAVFFFSSSLCLMEAVFFTFIIFFSFAVYSFQANIRGMKTYFAAVETWFLLVRLLKLSCNSNVGGISLKALDFRDLLEFPIHFSNINKILLI